ncbi:MAG: sensor domain-containing diguanylate cyclase [Acidobacteriaceae bacterium]
MREMSFQLRRVLFFAGLLGIVCLTALTAAVQYRNIRQLIDSRNWVEHSQEVLATLQTAQHTLDRHASEELLYRATGLSAYRKESDEDRVKFSAIVTRLQVLASDDRVQETAAQSLMAEFESQETSLKAAAPGAEQSREPSGAPEVSNTLHRMEATERRLLQARFTIAKQRANESVLATALFLAVAVCISITLFMLLWRDTKQRRGLQADLLASNIKLQTTAIDMQVRAEHSAITAAASEELQICIEPQESYRVATRFFAKVAPHSNGALALINNSRQMVETVAAWGAPDIFGELFPLEACCALRSGRKRWHEAASNEVHCRHFASTAPPNYYYCLPLSAHGETLGSVLMQFPHAADLAEAQKHRRTLEALGEMIAMAVANLNLREKLRNQSIRDGLTGLFNRKFMEIAFERELRRAERRNVSISIFMIDVDHFKELNDTNGHEVGDGVLRELAQLMLTVVRSEDIVCRYGGEGFVIIMPDMTLDIALERAERLRQQVEQMRVRYGNGPARQVTISIGIANYPADGATQEKLLKAADENLYSAKRQGINLIVSGRKLPLGSAI